MKLDTLQKNIKYNDIIEYFNKCKNAQYNVDYKLSAEDVMKYIINITAELSPSKTILDPNALCYKHIFEFVHDSNNELNVGEFINMCIHNNTYLLPYETLGDFIEVFYDSYLTYSHISTILARIKQRGNTGNNSQNYNIHINTLNICLSKLLTDKNMTNSFNNINRFNMFNSEYMNNVYHTNSIICTIVDILNINSNNIMYIDLFKESEIDLFNSLLNIAGLYEIEQLITLFEKTEQTGLKFAKHYAMLENIKNKHDFRLKTVLDKYKIVK